MIVHQIKKYIDLDLALIRRLKLAKSILMASEGQASVGFQTAMIFGYM